MRPGDKPFLIATKANVDAPFENRRRVTTPPIPPETQPFLRYLPTIAEFIRTDRRPSRGELSLVRMFAPDVFNGLRALTYEKIVELASPYEADEEFAPYVRLVKSGQGRAWLTDVLAQIKSM